MFLKTFLVFISLILYTTSRAIIKQNCKQKTEQLEKTILSSKQNNCSSSLVQKINFTHIDKLYEKHQAVFCQVSKVLKTSNCTDSNVKELRRLSDQIKGNVPCKSQESGTLTPIRTFLSNLEEYVRSLKSNCPKN